MDTKLDYKLITDINELKAYIKDTNIVAFDFETAPNDNYRTDSKAALHPRTSHICGCSFSTRPYTAVYVPVRHRGYKNIDSTLFFTFLKKILENECIVKVAHNLSFEAMFSYDSDIVIQKPVYDTICASQLTKKSFNEFYSLKESGLKTLAKTRLNEELPTYETVTNGRWFDELNPEDPETVRYGCADSDFALRLYYHFNDNFECSTERSHKFICEEIESPTAVYVGMMELNGVPLDVEHMKNEQAKAETKINEILQKIKFIIGDVNIGKNAATDAFRNYLYKDLALPVLSRTDSNAPAVDDESMMRLRDYCKTNKPEIANLFDLVLEYKKLGKIKTTYIDGYLKLIDKETNKVYPRLLQLATDTGRFACDKPNIQNLPQAEDDPLKIRSYIKADDGYQIMEFDYSQAELRIGAYLSKDEMLTRAYKEGVDVHAITTSGLFGITEEEAHDKTHEGYKRRRTIAKQTMFGNNYGISSVGLQRRLYVDAGLTLTKEECDQFLAKLKKKYRGFTLWQYDAIRYAKFHSQTMTALGRIRPLPDIMSESYGKRKSAERMALNTPIQGLCADLLKLSMARLLKAIKDHPYIKPIFTVHDSLVFIVPNDKIEEASWLIKSAMEIKPPLKDFIGLVADVAYGPNYGELKDE